MSRAMSALRELQVGLVVVWGGWVGRVLGCGNTVDVELVGLSAWFHLPFDAVVVVERAVDGVHAPAGDTRDAPLQGLVLGGTEGPRAPVLGRCGDRGAGSFRTEGAHRATQGIDGDVRLDERHRVGEGDHGCTIPALRVPEPAEMI